jgi:hypothetical protein
MTRTPGRSPGPRQALVEASALGLSYGAALCWGGVCLLASFRPDNLSAPYWSGLPGLRSDTAGIAAFAVVAVCGTLSEFLRLRRGGPVISPRRSAVVPGTGRALVTALSRVAALLSAGLVAYLSVNAVTHPATLALHLTHLISWPAEGTVRVLALVLAVVSAAACRYLAARASADAPHGRPLISGPAQSGEPLLSGPAAPRAVPGSPDQPGAQRSTQ